jgi:hypothetical protein
MIFAPAILRPGIFRNAFGAGRFASPSNTDELSLDIQFAADKSLTARRGPTPTFTRASTATFVGSDGLIQSAAINAPRFDHDPVTLACKGLLIEESKTNFVINSDLYLTSTPTNITATTITGTSVTGSNQIRELSLTSSGAFTGVQANLTGTGTGIKTLSVFIKKPPANAAPYFTIGFASATSVYAGIQLTMSGSSPVVSVTSTAIGGFSVVSSSIEAFSNDWYRVSVVASGVPASCFPTFYPSNAVWNGTSDIRQTLTAAGTNLIYVFGAQVELGSFPTSYIPTTTVALTRSADVCSITGSDFTSFYNQSEWTLYADLSGLMSEPLGGQRPFVAISDGTYSNFFSILKASGTGSFQAEALTSSALQFRLGNAYAPYTRYKIALGAKTDNANASYNGVLKITDTTVTMPSTMNRLEFRDPTGAAAGHPSFHIASIRYYKKRLPDAKLQSLTS